MNEEIKKIIFEGTDAQRRYLFSFNLSHSKEDIVKKFNLFARYFFPKFFKSKDAPFHTEMLLRLAGLYLGQETEFLNIGFRGCSKTTFTKLFVIFTLACDEEHSRKYIKILSSDLTNSKQFVVDIYNLLISPRVLAHYPELFEKTDYKKQETMEVIDFATGVKVTAGTVGQVQRGNVQEDSRPDLIIFDDVETRMSLRSAVKTRAIWDSMQEAIDGLAPNGITIYLANYVSERGNVHRLVERIKNKMIIPIEENGEPTWKERYTKEQITLLRSKSDDWEGEYLCKPSASKDVLFDRDSIDAQTPKIPTKTIAGFKIFQEFIPSHRIAGGADVALGVGLDSSTSVFIDFDVMPAQVVGTYHNNEIRPFEFGDELARQGRIFGECLIAPEKNNAGVSTIDRLKQIYPMSRIYATQRKATMLTYADPTEFGWDTNALTKPQMLNDLASAVSDGLLSLNDEDLIRECRSYTRNDLMDRDVDVRMVTRHFDLLMATAIAWAMRNYAVRSSAKKETNQIDELWERNKAIAFNNYDSPFE